MKTDSGGGASSTQCMFRLVGTSVSTEADKVHHADGLDMATMYELVGSSLLYNRLTPATTFAAFRHAGSLEHHQVGICGATLKKWLGPIWSARVTGPSHLQDGHGHAVR